jgi:rhamnosyltransferase
MASPHAVSVVIPTLNAGPGFRVCLDAVRAQTLDRPVEIVVIDSGSTDGTLDVCRETGIRLLTIEPGTFNHGLTRNRAIAAATGEFVALLTQDAVPMGTDWLARHVEALTNTPRAAGSYGRQVPHDSVNPYLRWRLDQWAATRTDLAVQEIADRAAFDALPPIEKLAVVAFDNVNSCVRRSAWAAMPFSELDFGEDIDWGVRVTQAGWALVYEPRARVRHSHDDSLWTDFNRIRADHRNLHRLLGMRQVPTLRAVLRCTVSGVRTLWGSVPLDAYAARERLYWKLYAIPWSFAQTMAQYAAVRSSH